MWMFLLALSLVLLAPGPSGATIRYLAPGGSNTGNCDNSNAPCQTFDYVRTKVQGGDTVYFRQGSYPRITINGQQPLANGISDTNRTVLAGDPRDPPLSAHIDGINFDYYNCNDYTGFVEPSCGLSRYFIIRNFYTSAGGSGCGYTRQQPVNYNCGLHYARFEDLEYSDPNQGHGSPTGQTSGGCFGVSRGASDIEYVNIHVHHCGSNLPYDGAHPSTHGFYSCAVNTTYDRIHAHHNGGYGIQMYESTDEATGCGEGTIIRNSYIHDNGVQSEVWGGIVMGDGHNLQVYNNVITNNHGSGLAIPYSLAYDELYNVAVYNNTVVGNKDTGIALGNPPRGGYTLLVNPQIKNNIVQDNGGQAIKTDDWECPGGQCVSNPVYEKNLCNSLTNGCTNTGAPAFVNAGNPSSGCPTDDPSCGLKITQGSAARNQGVSLTTFNLDKAGLVRSQQGPKWDIGPYEYQEGGGQAFDFLLPSPGTKTVVQGSSVTFPVTATYNGGTAAFVAFSVSALPSGVSASFTGSPCTPSCTANLTLTATGGAPVGTYTTPLLAAQTSGGEVVRDTNFTIVVTAPTATFDFSLASPGPQTVSRSAAVTVPLTLSLVSGTAGPVTLSVTAGLPAGVTHSFTNTPCTPPCTAQLTLAASGSAAVGTTPIPGVRVHGAGGSQSHDVDFVLTVTNIISSANPIYVRKTAGSPSHSCTDAENPATAKQTIVDACQCMIVPGKVMLIEGNGNTYVEQIDTGGGCPLTGGNGPSYDTATRLEGYGSPVPVIQAPTGAAMALHLRGSGDQYLIFKKLAFDAANQAPNAVAIFPTAHHVRFEAVEMKNTVGGFEPLYLTGASNIELVDTFLHDAGTHALTLDGSISNFLCQRCHLFNAAQKGLNVNSNGTKTNLTFQETEVRNNTGIGVDIGASTGTILQNLLVRSNGGHGVEIRTGASGTRAYNNTIYSNTGVGLQCDSGATSTEFRNNIVYGNTGGNIVNNCGATVAKNLCAVQSVPCALGGDPLFVAAPTNLHLADGSPAIDAGEAIPSILTDYDGNPRRQGPQDIGAYERAVVTSPPGPGVLRVATSNPRYFENPAGEIVYLTGAYSWNFASTMPDAEVTAYLNYAQSHNHNYLRAPSQDYDGSAQSTDYFSVLAARVQQAAALGIYVGVSVFPALTTVAPFNNLAFDEAYARSLVQAVGAAPNVLYEVGNELDTQALDGGTLGFFVNRIVDVINDEQAIRGFTPRRMVSISDFRATGATYVVNPAVVSFLLGSHADFVQIGFSQANTGTCDILPDYGGQKVSMPDSDHIEPYHCGYPWVWQMLMNGGNPTLLEGNAFFPDHTEPDNPSDTTGAALTYDARIRMGDTRTYALKLHLNQAVPHPELSSTGYLLAWPAHEYLVYQPTTGAFTVQVPAGPYTVEWFDPTARTTTSTTQTVASPGAISFTSPLDPTHDAVLLLKAAPAPPSGQDVTVRQLDLRQVEWYF